MSDSINLSEVIFRENIEDAADVARQSAKLMHNYVQRAQYQNAPRTLVDELIIIRNRYAELCDRIEWLMKYFPEE